MEEVSGSVDVSHAQRGAISVRNARVPARASSRFSTSFPARGRPPITLGPRARESETDAMPYRDHVALSRCVVHAYARVCDVLYCVVRFACAKQCLLRGPWRFPSNRRLL